ncbi:MAG: hypothetical protein A4E65_00218 [Syntrophorhabdus sp. PtaU1.Bin153]|nr:MAG: hypothetical protein A4E65_00218 [Syntrophorhabdus sp. PtaU1.Bin153]
MVKGLPVSTVYTLVFDKTGYKSQSTSVTTGSSQIITDAGLVFMPTLKTAVAPFEEYNVILQWNSVEPYSAACGLSDSAADCANPATGNQGTELDLYVSRPDGQIIYWSNLGDQYGEFTRDSFLDMMPGEGVYIKNLQTSPEGTYKIAVNRYLWGTIANVNAKVTLAKGATSSNNWTVPANCTQNWWVVATIDPTTGSATTINTCQDEYPF